MKLLSLGDREQRTKDNNSNFYYHNYEDRAMRVIRYAYDIENGNVEIPNPIIFFLKDEVKDTLLQFKEDMSDEEEYRIQKAVEKQGILGKLKVQHCTDDLHYDIYRKVDIARIISFAFHVENGDILWNKLEKMFKE